MIVSTFAFRSLPRGSAFPLARLTVGPTHLQPTRASLRNYSTSKNPTSQIIGFIGLGQMGYRMASNLRTKTKNTLLLHDQNSSSTKLFLQEHQDGPTKILGSPMEVASEADVIVTMLPASVHAQNVYLGDKGILKGVRKHALLIDSSTISPTISRTISQACGEAGALAVDAPVSGGIAAAASGSLTFMVGGSTKGYKEAARILGWMGKNVVHCGDHGSGQAAKLCNNMLLGVSMLGVSEAMALGRRLGLDPKTLAGIINTSSGRCWSSDAYNPCPGVMEGVPSSKDYEGGFQVQLMAKDLRLAVEAANEVTSPIPISAVAQQLYGQVERDPKYKAKDFSSVFRWLGGDEQGGK